MKWEEAQLKLEAESGSGCRMVDGVDGRVDDKVGFG